ncbi:MAG TPA: division plane positioning ATPase MipZ [Bauldia sp.]|nr:division plane positioning ATPase MipZ [Bauldia sp.]
MIVLGNEKGGTGKSTTAMHIIVALMKSGCRVASIDTDSRQRSLTRYLENRGRWARETGRPLEIPAHYVVRLGAGEAVREIEAREFSAYADIIDKVERDFDFVVVDTPGSDSYLMRLSHAMADTLVTPVNDSFVDLDVLGRVVPGTRRVEHLSQYAELVRSARAERLRVDGTGSDWVVVRNRLSPLVSRNQLKVSDGLFALSGAAGFRIANGISERVIFREFFPIGLTALDRLDRETLGGEPTMSHVAARQEIRELIAALDLVPPAHHEATAPSLVPSEAPAAPELVSP